MRGREDASSSGSVDEESSAISAVQDNRLTLCDLPKGSFDPHEDNSHTQLLRSIAPCDVFWEGDVHRASLAEVLLSFFEFGNEGCAKACAVAFECTWGPLGSYCELAADIRFEAARSGKLRVLQLAIAILGGKPLNVLDMLIAARTGQSGLVAEICAVLPSDVCDPSFMYVADGQVDSHAVLRDGRQCCCLACSIFENMSDFECFVAVCLNWTFDEDSVAVIVKEVGRILWKLPAGHVRGIYTTVNASFMCWMDAESLRHILAYWPLPVVFLRGLIPDVNEFHDAFLDLISRGLLVGELREAHYTLDASSAAALQRAVIRLNTGLDLPAAMDDAMPIIVDYL